MGRFRWQAAAAAGLLFAGAACSGDAQPPAAPRDLTATLVGSTIQLRWTPPAGRIDGYHLDARFGPYPYRALTAEPLPADWAGVDLALDVQAMPEAVTLVFRLRVVAGDAYVASNEASVVFEQTLSASGMVATVARDGAGKRTGPISVRWVRRSASATALRLERRALPIDGPAEPWVELPVAFEASPYVDEDVEDLTAYAYRVTYWAERTGWSEAAEAASEPTDLRPPNLAVRATPAGVEATWTSSPKATELLLDRCPADSCPVTVGTFPASSSGTLDPIVPWPVERYQLTALRRDATGNIVAFARSPIVSLPPFRIEGGASVLEARAISLPHATSAAMDMQGRLVLFDALSRTLYLPAPGGWDAYVLSDLATGWSKPPDFFLDSQDHPHLVSSDVSSGTPGLRHWWHDGTALRSEDVSRGGFTSVGAGAAADGTVQVLYTRREPDYSTTTVYALREASVWSEELVPGAPSHFAVAPDGWAFSIFGDELRGRDPLRGTWSASKLPGVASPDLLLAANGERAAVVDVSGDSARSPPYQLQYLTAEGRSWSAPELALASSSSLSSPTGAFSPDAARVHVLACEEGAGLVLAERQQDGWTRTTLGSPCPSRWRSGYREGKLWVLARFNQLGGGMDAALLTEP